MIYYFANKGPSRQSYGFPSVMNDYESWTKKKVESWRMDTFELWCWRKLFRVPWTAKGSNPCLLNWQADSPLSHQGIPVLTLECFPFLLWFPLGLMEISQSQRNINPKGKQSWIFIGRTDAETETPILWPPDVKNQLIGKELDAGKDWRREETGMTEDEMIGWHYWQDGHEFEWALGVGDGQRSLACCSPWGHKESDMTEWLNWSELNSAMISFFGKLKYSWFTMLC